MRVQAIRSLFLPIIGVAFVISQPAFSQEAEVQFPAGARIVTARGTGTVRTAPDEAVIVLGVKTWSKDLRDSYAENEASIKRLLAVSSKYHVDKNDVQISQVSVEASHQSKFSGSYEASGKPNSYWIQKKITLVVKDLSCIPALLADAIDAGANTIDSLNFAMQNSRKYRDEARALALKAAREKAQAMAGELNAKIGKAIMIKEIDPNFPTWARRNSISNSVQEDPAATDSAEANTDGIAKGQLKIDSSVSVTFELTD